MTGSPSQRDVYVAPEVAKILALHPYLADPDFRSRPIREQIALQAKTLHGAFRAADERVGMHVLCWWPPAIGRGIEDAFALDFAIADAEETIRREYGFVDAAALDALGDLAPDAQFEMALDETLAGDIAALSARLDQNPQLATARSRFGHRATLLHYLGANGVESHRQVTPLNAAALADLLIQNGASRTATAEMYGGGQTPHMLAGASAHPHLAGVAEDLNRSLLGGADRAEAGE